jgi:hypothetical protein
MASSRTSRPFLFHRRVPHGARALSRTWQTRPDRKFQNGLFALSEGRPPLGPDMRASTVYLPEAAYAELEMLAAKSGRISDADSRRFGLASRRGALIFTRTYKRLNLQLCRDNAEQCCRRLTATTRFYLLLADWIPGDQLHPGAHAESSWNRSSPVLQHYQCRFFTFRSYSWSVGSGLWLSIHVHRLCDAPPSLTLHYGRDTNVLFDGRSHETEAKVRLRGVMRSGQYVQCCVWRKPLASSLDCERFHDRFIISELGGIGIQGGAGVASKSQHTSVYFLSNADCQNQLNMFDSNAPVFELLSRFDIF